MSYSVKEIALTGMGIALFVSLSMCLRVPVFENYYLCLGYIVMTVYCYSFGIIQGTIVGVIGTVLYCVLINGLRGMPGWALGNIVIGVMIGYTFKVIKKVKKPVLQVVIYAISTVLATSIAILGVKSMVECILYAQPLMVRIANNIYAFIADVFVICMSVPICQALDPHIKKIAKQN